MYFKPDLGSSLTWNVDLDIEFSTERRQKSNIMSNCTLFCIPQGVSGLIYLESYSFRQLYTGMVFYITFSNPFQFSKHGLKRDDTASAALNETLASRKSASFIL